MRSITAWALDHMATNGTIDVAKNFNKEEKTKEMLDVLKVVCSVLKPHEVSEETVVAYAVQDEIVTGGKRRAALLTLDGRWLHLHHLKDAPPPPHAITLPYNAIRDLVETGSGLCFLDLGWPGSTRGRLHVRLLGNTGRALQFIYLCTGEKGPSYAHTNFTALKNKGRHGEWLAGGDYDGKCAAPLVDGLTEGGEYQKPKVAGLVGGVYAKGSNRNGLFGIWVREEANPKPCDLGFAKVEHGLAVLKSAAGYSNIKEVKILDCGVVIPL
ncbi:unnamed protein product [Meganyctiphanes norvegica]|uniref:Uncharacterized protein n=1 Tax=Meganyctiphanes norvegica TaxID=48144 RepID=A0AAV2SGR4_MEGNR